MADEDHSSTDLNSEQSSTSEVDGEEVETLIEGREKRATAGNRLSTLLDKEADDELGLLFAEDEEDVEFDASGDESDVQLESSSDEDDQGTTTGQGDPELEGEKELERQARLDRQAKKRKAQDLFLKPTGSRKRVKVDPTSAGEAPITPAPRPKKKSERFSWIPTPDQGPTRSSSRRLTVKNKEVVHARMKESEKRRLKQIEIMEAAAKRKESSKPKALTQADRLAEAERTEKKNSKSLNRWEEAENKRSEEQKAKLAALHNRQLEGPVITWWSGMAQWVNGKLSRLGLRDMIQEVDDKTNTKQSKRQDPAVANATKSSITLHTEQATSNPPQPVSASSRRSTAFDPLHQDVISSPGISPQNGHAGFLDGIHYYASLPEHIEPANQHPTVSQGVPQVYKEGPSIHSKSISPVVESSMRSLVVLENFDPIAVRDVNVQRRILFKNRMLKPIKPMRELCVITSQPARFRDPSTGLPYSTLYAYQEIQRLRGGSFMWSNLLGCYVGPTGVAARGVPERFYWKHSAKRIHAGNAWQRFANS